MFLTHWLFMLLALDALVLSKAQAFSWLCNQDNENGTELCGRIFGYPQKDLNKISADVPFNIFFYQGSDPALNVSCYFEYCPPWGICGDGLCNLTSNSRRHSP
jgi:hypothetical protein